MMSRMPERDKRALKFLGISGGAILLFVLVAAPTLDRWDALNKELDDTQKKTREIQTRMQDALEARTLVRALRRNARLHPTAASLQGQTGAMLRQLEALAGYRALTVRRLEGLPLREDDDYYRSGVTLQFESQLPDLVEFLAAVEAAEPKLKVERLSLSTNQKRPNQVEGQMVISSYAVMLKQEGKQ